MIHFKEPSLQRTRYRAAVPEGFGAISEGALQIRGIDGAHGSAAGNGQKFLHCVAEQGSRLFADKSIGIGVIVIADFQPPCNGGHDNLQLPILLESLLFQFRQAFLDKMVGLPACFFGEKLVPHQLLIGVGTVDVDASELLFHPLINKGHPLVHLYKHFGFGVGGNPHPAGDYIQPGNRFQSVILFIPNPAGGNIPGELLEEGIHRILTGDVLLFSGAKPGELRR